MGCIQAFLHSVEEEPDQMGEMSPHNLKCISRHNILYRKLGNAIRMIIIELPRHNILYRKLGNAIRMIIIVLPETF